MAFTRMIDMEYDDEDSLDAAQPIAMPDRPRYPYGLRICLTDKELPKLDMGDDVPQVGDLIDLRAMAKVTSVSATDDEGGGPCCRIELQITHLAVENEETEGPGDDAPRKRPARGVLYDRGGARD